MPPTPTSTPEAPPPHVPSPPDPAVQPRWKAPEGLGHAPTRNAASPALPRPAAPAPAGPQPFVPAPPRPRAAAPAPAGGPEGTGTHPLTPPQTAPRRTAPPATEPPAGPPSVTGRAARAAGRPGGRRDLRRPGGSARPGGTRPGEARPAAVRPRPPAGPTAAAARPRVLPPHVMFAERLLAVLTGERPVHWMLGHTIGEAYEQLIRLAPANPLRPAAATRGSRPVLRRCGGAPLSESVVEAYATVTTGARVRAMAFRLERGQDRRWRCAAVDLGPA